MRVAEKRILSFSLALLAILTFGRSQNLTALEPEVQLKEGAVAVNGVELFYRIGGNGPPLLLIHGFSAAGYYWDRFLEEFGPHYTLIIPDVRGHGRSTNPLDEFTYQDVARDMFGLLDHLGIGRVKGIGYSAGGNTLIHMAVQQPERVEAMVLVAGAHRLTLDARESLRRWPSLQDLPEEWRDFFLRQHPGGEPQIRSLFSQLRALADNYSDFDFSPEHLSTIPTRTLLVWGDRDEFYPMDVVLELYEALPNAALCVLPGQGHMFLATEFGGSEAAEKMFLTTVLPFLEQIR
jgi:pimeloyl-ACP methyl ester carboxylesterase